MKTKKMRMISMCIIMSMCFSAWSQDMAETEQNIQILKELEQSKQNKVVQNWVTGLGLTISTGSIIGWVGSIIKIKHYRKQALEVATEAANKYLAALPEHVASRLNQLAPAQNGFLKVDWEFLYRVQKHLVDIFSVDGKTITLTEDMMQINGTSALDWGRLQADQVLKALESQFDHLLSQLGEADKTKATLIKEMYDGLFYIANATTFIKNTASNENLILNNLQNIQVKLYTSLQNIANQTLRTRSDQFLSRPVLDRFMVNVADNIQLLVGQTNVNDFLARTRFSPAALLNFQKYASSVDDLTKIMKSGGNPVGHNLLGGAKTFADDIDFLTRAKNLCKVGLAGGIATIATGYFLSSEHETEESEFKNLDLGGLLEINPFDIAGAFADNRVSIDVEEEFNETVNGVRSAIAEDCELQEVLSIDMRM